MTQRVLSNVEVSHGFVYCTGASAVFDWGLLPLRTFPPRDAGAICVTVPQGVLAYLPPRPSAPGSLGGSTREITKPGFYQPVQRSRTHADTGARPRRVEEVLQLWPSMCSNLTA